MANKHLPKIIGIYAIINIANGKLYVGSSIHCRKRWIVHKHTLNYNTHYNPYLQNAWNFYGVDSFELKILETVDDKSKLLEREQYWINKTKCYNENFGYNSRRIPNRNAGLWHTDETKIKISLGGKGRIVSDETKQRMRQSAKNRGDWPHENGAKCKCDFCKAKLCKYFSDRKKRIKLEKRQYANV